MDPTRSRFKIFAWSLAPWMVVGLFLLGRLVHLQVRRTSTLQQLATAQHLVELEHTDPRLTIIDARGEVLAIDLPAKDLFAHPALFRVPPAKVADVLAPILGTSSHHLRARFRESPTGVCLAYQLDMARSNQVARLSLDGLELVNHPQRLYPQRAAVASVVGYVDTEGQGQAGVEASFDAGLRQPPRIMSSWVTGRGSLLARRFPRPLLFESEQALQLTLDTDLQVAVVQLLQSALQQFQARRIAAIVMEAQTGAIRCLATVPGFDPNDYQRFDVDQFRCWPVMDLFEPGSTFKPVNMAIALEHSAVGLIDRVPDSGVVHVNGTRIENVGAPSRGHAGRTTEWLTPADVLRRSSNVGMVRIMRRLDPNRYHRSLVRLGIGAPAPAPSTACWDFVSAPAPSVLKPRREFVEHPIEPATAAFGQGIAMTPLKLLQLIAVLANGGVSVTPHVVWGVVPYGPYGVPEGQPYQAGWLLKDGQPLLHPRVPLLPRCLQPRMKPSAGLQGEEPVMWSSWHGLQDSVEPSPPCEWQRPMLRPVQGRPAPRARMSDLYFGHVPVPSVELGWVDPVTIPPHARGRRRMFSPQTCQAVRSMLTRVVQEHDATGARCFIPGYEIAGKTGTAQKPSASGGYLPDAVVTSFAGIYPAKRPQLVTLVVIDEPLDPYRFASDTAADLTQAILAKVALLDGDSPSYPVVNAAERDWTGK